jgi:predicted extracellular nuclease
MSNVFRVLFSRSHRATRVAIRSQRKGPGVKHRRTHRLVASTTSILLVFGLLGGTAFAESHPVINEFVANHTGTDTHEYLEVAGEADTDYSSYTILHIEGDGAGAGVIDTALTVGTTNGDGIWVSGFLTNEIENGTISLLLVEGFTGSEGNDLDTDNDGVFDVTPWTQLVDDVAVSDGGSADHTYSTTVLASGFDGSSPAPGGASRIPNSVDTDSVSDWTRNDFDLAGIPGFPGTLEEGEAANTPGAVNSTEPPDNGENGVLCDDEEVSITLISEIQGTGLSSPMVGNTVVVEAVVVGDFQNDGDADDGNLNGFHLQEEDAEADTDPASSEGIFVFHSADPNTVGDVVRVRGTVAEFTGSGSSQTQIASVTDLDVCDSGATLPTPSTIEFPLTDLADLEPSEGMRVTFPQSLAISEYFNYDRFGEMVLSLPFSPRDRLFQPTAFVEPGPDANAEQALVNLRRITLDDGQSSQNPDFNRHPNGDEFSLTNSFRGGDTVTNATGVIDHTFGLYRIQPTEPADYVAANPRPSEPSDVGGSVTVASFNVLNYFLTLDEGNDVCGPEQNLGCRGANDEEEFERQRSKILEALATIEADVFGLIEMENTTGVEPLADIVDGLNELTGASYEFIDTGTIGTDAIKVGIIYDTATVSPVGDYAILDSTVDPRFNDDKSRPVLAQTFSDGSGAFTVAVNHLKSKGSSCNDVGDPDQGDGQGNCNGVRTAAAEAMVDWLASDPTGSGDGDFLITGDLNSYGKEDPIDVLIDGGYTELVHQFVGEFAYSFVFDGLFGYLDHALSTDTLTRQVAGTTVWHINADEPDILDYDTSFKSATQIGFFDGTSPFRSSDHDPVIVGIDVNASPVCEAAAPSQNRLFPPDHRFVPINVLGVTDPEDDHVTITIDSIFQDEAVDAPDSGNTAPDGRGVGTSTAEVRAERVGKGGNGRVYHIAFTAVDAFGGSCSGEVLVEVPVSPTTQVVDDGPLFDSTVGP